MRGGWRRFQKRARRRIKGRSEKADAFPVQPAADGGNGPDEKPPRNPEQPSEDDALPPFYGETRVVLLPVDPYLVYVYWELAPNEWEQAKERLQGANPVARPVLRFHEIRNAHAPFDVDIELSAGNWYLHLWSPEKSYFVELGLKEEDGGFVSLARSNVAHTPRAVPSARVEERYLVVGAAEGRRESALLRAEHAPAPQMEKPAAPKSAGEPHPKPLDSIAPLAAEKRQPGEVHVPEHVDAAEETQPALLETPAQIDPAEILRRKLAQLYAVRKWPVSPEATAPTTPQPPSERSHYLDLTEMDEASMALGYSSGAAVRREAEN